MRFPIERGLDVEQPHGFVRWFLSPEELVVLFGSELKKIAPDQYRVGTAEALGGLRRQLGFYFNEGRLVEIEILANPDIPLAQSFAMVEQHFRAAFGEPNFETPGPDNFSTFEWQLGSVSIYHAVRELDGKLEELARIEKVFS
jgi:hypothetical protein